MSTEFQPFDDPALKAALKRLYAEESAPAALRGRVSTLLGGHSATMPASGVSYQPSRQSRLLAFWRRPALHAVAAGFVIGIIGLTIGIYLLNLQRNQPQLPDHQTLAALLRTHDSCCDMPAHSMQGFPATDLRTTARTICKKLNDSVFAANLERDGWEFKGANICSVGPCQTAHLIFAKGGLRMSVFSMPCKSAGNCRPFRQTINNHLIAGFTSKGRLYCLIGTCPKDQLQLDEVASLLEEHQNDIETPDATVAHVNYTPDPDPLH